MFADIKNGPGSSGEERETVLLVTLPATLQYGGKGSIQFSFKGRMRVRILILLFGSIRSGSYSLNQAN
jgi:hypothetical protein